MFVIWLIAEPLAVQSGMVALLIDPNYMQIALN